MNPTPLPPVVCFGAGAIGSLVGARLHEAGLPVALVGRGRHLAAVQRSGLTLDETSLARVGGPGGRKTIHLPAYDRLADALSAVGGSGSVGPAVVILTVKAYDVAAAVEEIAGETPGATVVCLENGLGTEETAAARLGRDRVIAGAITLSVERPEPGTIKLLTRQGGIALAPLRPSGGLSGSRLAPVVAALGAAGFRVRLHRSAASVKWSKVLLNLWANATSAIFDAPPDRVVGDRRLFALDWLAFHEALAVMRRAGIPIVDLPGYPVRLLAAVARLAPREAFRTVLGRRVAAGRGGKMPSFWLDLAAGRDRSEVGFINGAVADAARRAGLEAPANQVLALALTALTERRLPRDRFSRELALSGAGCSRSALDILTSGCKG